MNKLTRHGVSESEASEVDMVEEKRNELIKQLNQYKTPKNKRGKTQDQLKKEAYNAELQSIQLKAREQKLEYERKKPDETEIEELFKMLHKEFKE